MTKFKLTFLGLIFLANPTLSDILIDFDLMPIKESSNIVFMSNNDFRQKYKTISESNITPFLSLKSNSNYSMRFNKTGKFNLTSEIGFLDLALDQKNFKNKIKSKNFKILFSNLKDISFNRTWKPYFGLDYYFIEEAPIYCFEGINEIIGYSEQKCRFDNILFHLSSSNNSPVVKIQGSSKGINFGFRRKIETWSKKTIYKIGINSNYVNLKNTIGENFLHNFNAYNKSFLQKNPWTDSTLEISLRQAFKRGSKIGLGYSITGYYNDLKNYNKSIIDNQKTNFKINTLFSYLFFDNIILSIGGEYSKNSVIGYSPLNSIQTLVPFKNKSNIALNFQISSLLNWEEEKEFLKMNIYNNLNKTNNENKKITKFKKNKRKILLGVDELKSKTPKVNDVKKDLTLKEYALLIANKYDKNIMENLKASYN